MTGNINLTPTELAGLILDGLKKRFGNVNVTSIRFYNYEKDNKATNLSDFNTIHIEFGEDEDE